MIKGKLFDEMGQICEYFRRNAQDQPLFEPEFKTASFINAIIESLSDLQQEDVVRILHAINATEDIEHYEGSGWMDYKMHLNALLKKNGFDITWKKDRKWIL